jgi:hypothetical protein
VRKVWAKLQSYINRNGLLQTNHNLVNVLSKTMLANTSIEDHINRRLAKIIQIQQNFNNRSQKSITVKPL